MQSVNIGRPLNSDELAYSEKVRGKGTSFDRIRRITGYLVGNLDRFGTGKRAEEHDRVKHDTDKLAYLEAKLEVKEYVEA